MEVLCILGNPYIIGSNLSRPVTFRSNILWLQQQNVCGVILDMISVIRFKNNEKAASVFTNTCDRWHIIIWDTCFVPKPENIWNK